MLVLSLSLSLSLSLARHRSLRLQTQLSSAEEQLGVADRARNELKRQMSDMQSNDHDGK